jgi:hypothetical protein
MQTARLVIATVSMTLAGLLPQPAGHRVVGFT